MTPDDRTRCLESTHTHLTWLTTDHTPGRTRWTTVHQVLAGHQAAATITSPPDTGRSPRGSHSDPVAAAILTLDAALTRSTRATEQLHALEETIAELARWLRSTLTGDGHPGPDTLTAAHADTAWLALHHRAILHPIASTSLLADIDDAINTLATVTSQLSTEVTKHLRAAVRTKPTIRQPRTGDCRSHRDADQPDHPVYRNGLCHECFNFRHNHGCDPTPAIIRRWDYGSAATPGQILEARAAARRKTRTKRRRNAGA